MSIQMINLNLTAALGAALAGSLIVSNATAGKNPFGMQALQGGYMQVAMEEGRCGGAKGKEGSCGGEKMASEGRCGGDKSKEGSCGGDKKTDPKATEGKCGEGKCGGSK